MVSPLFITFEGGEGSGKSTQIKLLADKLKEIGCDFIKTREPGGTPEAEKIRNLLVQRDGGEWSPAAECLMMFAARSMHVQDVILPALAQGKVVLCDRFSDSTYAYQGYGHEVSIANIGAVETASIGDFKPDITFIFDIDAEEGLKRSSKRLADQGSQEDRFENMDIDFHKRLRQGFLDIAKNNPARCFVIDATKSVDDIATEILSIVQPRINV